MKAAAVPFQRLPWVRVTPDLGGLLPACWLSEAWSLWGVLCWGTALCSHRGQLKAGAVQKTAVHENLQKRSASASELWDFAADLQH